MTNKKQDKLIEQMYYKLADGVQINIMDIPKVFQAGRQALKDNQDLEQAIRAVISVLRTN
jgi:hypothetical protein